MFLLVCYQPRREKLNYMLCFAGHNDTLFVLSIPVTIQCGIFCALTAKKKESLRYVSAISLNHRFYLHSNKNTAPQMPIKNTILMVSMSTVIWWPRSQMPLFVLRCGPPTPLTMVKCVELASETVSTSLDLLCNR